MIKIVEKVEMVKQTEFLKTIFTFIENYELYSLSLIKVTASICRKSGFAVFSPLLQNDVALSPDSAVT